MPGQLGVLNSPTGQRLMYVSISWQSRAMEKKRVYPSANIKLYNTHTHTCSALERGFEITQIQWQSKLTTWKTASTLGHKQTLSLLRLGTKSKHMPGGIRQKPELCLNWAFPFQGRSAELGHICTAIANVLSWTLQCIKARQVPFALRWPYIEKPNMETAQSVLMPHTHKNTPKNHLPILLPEWWCFPFCVGWRCTAGINLALKTRKAHSSLRPSISSLYLPSVHLNNKQNVCKCHKQFSQFFSPWAAQSDPVLE